MNTTTMSDVRNGPSSVNAPSSAEHGGPASSLWIIIMRHHYASSLWVIVGAVEEEGSVRVGGGWRGHGFLQDFVKIVEIPQISDIKRCVHHVRAYCTRIVIFLGGSQVKWTKGFVPPLNHITNGAVSGSTSLSISQ